MVWSGDFFVLLIPNFNNYIMKNRLFGLLLLLLLSACGLESPYSLPEKLPVNPELSGVWQEKQDGKSMLIITPKNKTRYNLEVILDKTKKDGKNSQSEFFETQIGNYKIVNLIDQDKDGKQKNLFCTYTLEPDILVFRLVNEPQDSIQLDSPEMLLQYFKNHIDDAGFFDEPVTMIRQK